MEFEELVQKAEKIKKAYTELNRRKGRKAWGVTEYAQGFVSDVGELMELMMARNGFRSIDDIDKKLAHELADCSWSIMIIAEELGVDLELEFLNTMEELEQRISSEKF